MPFILLAIIALIVGAATIVECHTGTPFVLDNIYGAWWTKVLWAAMSILSVWQIIKRRLWTRLSVFLLHISFLTILAGALLTSLFGERGTMHIRTEAPAAAFFTKERHVKKMPFIIRLDSFTIAYHPGTNTPADYISHITCLNHEGEEIRTGTVSMNNIFKAEGYRLYQASYDTDGQGTHFTVNHDPWGISITYAGYLLLSLSAFHILFTRRTRWGNTFRKPLQSKIHIFLLSALAIIALIALAQQHATGTSETSIYATRLQAESLYKSIPYSKILFIFNLSFGFALLSTSYYFPQVHRRISPYSKTILYTSTTFTAIIYIMRWYIGGRIPLANGHETMLFMALATLCMSCVLSRRHFTVIPFGLIISGFTLLVSHLAQMSTQIDTPMPVLQSPLLSIHVSIIMIAYTLFAFMTINAVTALLLMRKKSGREQAERLTAISRIMLYPATLLLAIGIFIGAVWANVSWGSYWSWDPKEVWALITMIVYGIAFHDTSITWLRSDRNFNIYIALAFLTALMTYFGVNYLLGGMHSYAN